MGKFLFDYKRLFFMNPKKLSMEEIIFVVKKIYIPSSESKSYSIRKSTAQKLKVCEFVQSSRIAAFTEESSNSFRKGSANITGERYVLLKTLITITIF